MRENSVVPPGLESFLSLFPALKRWAKLGRPSGAEFSISPHDAVWYETHFAVGLVREQSDVLRTGELQVWFLSEHLVEAPLVEGEPLRESA